MGLATLLVQWFLLAFTDLTAGFANTGLVLLLVVIVMVVGTVIASSVLNVRRAPLYSLIGILLVCTRSTQYSGFLLFMALLLVLEFWNVAPKLSMSILAVFMHFFMLVWPVVPPIIVALWMQTEAVKTSALTTGLHWATLMDVWFHPWLLPESAIMAQNEALLMILGLFMFFGFWDLIFYYVTGGRPVPLLADLTLYPKLLPDLGSAKLPNLGALFQEGSKLSKYGQQKVVFRAVETHQQRMHRLVFCCLVGCNFYNACCVSYQVGENASAEAHVHVANFEKCCDKGLNGCIRRVLTQYSSNPEGMGDCLRHSGTRAIPKEK